MGGRMERINLVKPILKHYMATDDSGIKVWDGHVGGSRYTFDFDVCKGWTQFDTDQDASYFGIWIHVEHRTIVKFAEGDLRIEEYPDAESFRAELQRMGTVYRPAPAFIGIDPEAGTVTEYYQDRAALVRQV